MVFVVYYFIRNEGNCYVFEISIAILENGTEGEINNARDANGCVSVIVKRYHLHNSITTDIYVQRSKAVPRRWRYVRGRSVSAGPLLIVDPVKGDDGDALR